MTAPPPNMAHAWTRPLLVALALTALVLPSVFAATLHGTIYHDDLSVARNVIVTINTAPLQRYVSMDGEYSFQAQPGDYQLSVTYALNQNKTMTEEVTITEEGSFRYDLFLFPDLTEDQELYDSLVEDLDEQPLALSGNNYWALGLLILLILALTILPWIFLKRRFAKLEANDQDRNARSHDERGQDANVEESSHERFGTRSADADAVVKLLKREGGRMTQKELRKHLPESEAKVSLLIAELEAKGVVEKIKKGRGNILILKKQ